MDRNWHNPQGQFIKNHPPLNNGKGEFVVKKIGLVRNRSFYYLAGLLSGDGWVYKTSNRNYGVAFETTKDEMANLCVISLKIISPTLKVRESMRRHSRKFPNGSVTNSQTHCIVCDSKELYINLFPFKKEPWPSLIPLEYTSNFIAGFFDAEGSINQRSKQSGFTRIGTYYNYSHPGSIIISQKKTERLIEIVDLLKRLGIKSCRYTREIHITGKANKLNFMSQIGFRLEYKRERLLSDLSGYRRLA